MNFVHYFDLYGKPAKQIPCILGSGAPTSATPSVVGLQYMDESNGALYKCTPSGWKPADAPSMDDIVEAVTRALPNGDEVSY